MIIMNNLIPVFVDSDRNTLNANPDYIQQAIWRLQAEKPWRKIALLLTHTLGNPFNIDRMLEFGLPLIEDNCDALGSEYNNKKTGSFGVMSTLSFYPAHHITCGEGGAVITNNAEY